MLFYHGSFHAYHLEHAGKYQPVTPSVHVFPLPVCLWGVTGDSEGGGWLFRKVSLPVTPLWAGKQSEGILNFPVVL